MSFANLVKNELIKTIGDQLPQEMIDKVMTHYEYPRKALCNEIKRKGKSCFDTASDKLLEMIEDTGTFQQGHFETVGKNHVILTVRTGGQWSPLELKVRIISRSRNPKIVEVYQEEYQGKNILKWTWVTNLM